MAGHGEQGSHEERGLLPARPRTDLYEERGRAGSRDVGWQEQVGEEGGDVGGAARGVCGELVACDVEEVGVQGGVGLDGEQVGQLRGEGGGGCG